MNKSLGRRIGVLAVTATTAVMVSASPALAYEDITIKDPYNIGMMHFHDDGDVFTVCDTNADGGAVLGKLYYKAIGGDWYVTQRETDGGDAGCDKFSHDVNGVGDYQMKLYWLGAGYQKEIAKSRVFNE